MPYHSRTIRAVLPTLVVLLGLALSACDNPIQFSPLAIETNPRELTQRNLDLLAARSQVAFVPFKFAVISDSHSQLAELDSAISAINRHDDLAFLLHAGDMSDAGLLQEYEWSIEILERLRIPYLTTIGNHDAINNGKENYRALFGPYDYSFVFNQVKFVVLNDNDWEFDNQVPRFDWLETQLAEYFIYRHQLVLSHVPPDDTDRFTSTEITMFHDILKDNFTSLFINGHNHGFSYREEILSNGLPIGFLTTGAVEKDHYIIVTVEADRTTFERMSF